MMSILMKTTRKEEIMTNVDNNVDPNVHNNDEIIVQTVEDNNEIHNHWRSCHVFK